MVLALPWVFGAKPPKQAHWILLEMDSILSAINSSDSLSLLAFHRLQSAPTGIHPFIPTTKPRGHQGRNNHSIQQVKEGTVRKIQVTWLVGGKARYQWLPQV